MKPNPLRAQERALQKLRRALSQTGPISQGSVQDRTDRRSGGAGYQWTRKVARKTVTVALTKEQFARMKEAVVNHRQLRRHLQEMEKISRRIIFATNPHQGRRKPLNKKVLGLI